MKLETSHQTQPAKKILVIGGSTYNQNTPKKISQALVDSKFLDEWAVIIAIHGYLKLRETNCPLTRFEDKIKSDFSLSTIFEQKIFLITNRGEFTVKTGCIYVLPDPGLTIDNKYLYTSFMGKNYHLKVCAESSRQSQRVFEQWLHDNPYDASGKKRQMTNEDVSSVDFQRLPLINVSDPVQLRAKAQKLPQKEVKYREMPCIDKFMSEVAASKTDHKKIAALLLCGLHGDGANGLKEIKNKGGETAVQLPDECCHYQRKNTDSMPKTALQIEPNHQIVTLEDKPDSLKLSDWLSSIK
ncbi:hypothetical protein H1Q63_35270 [Desmonostoc muscorum CCALA 125]|nr:hypothetical protein [Desmonostoc muscorum CCALA 125]